MMEEQREPLLGPSPSSHGSITPAVPAAGPDLGLFVAAQTARPWLLAACCYQDGNPFMLPAFLWCSSLKSGRSLPFTEPQLFSEKCRGSELVIGFRIYYGRDCANHVS